MSQNDIPITADNRPANKLPVALDTALLMLIFTLSLLYSRYIQTNNATAYRWIHVASFLVLVGIAVYLIADFFIQSANKKHLTKTIILGFMIVIVAIGPQAVAINLRHHAGPAQFITDSAVQTEEAVKMFISGKNPYVENYYKTPLYDFDHSSPALTHYIYLPATFLLPVPFYLVIKGILGWFDLRMLYMLFYFLTLWLLWQIPSNPVFKRALIIVFALNPEIVYYFVYGTNDIMATACMVASIYLVKKQKFIWAAVFLGIGLLTKQFVIIFLPFYLLYLYGQSRALIRDKDGAFSPLVKTGLVLAIMGVVFAAPVMLWNLRAFFDDVVKDPYGTAVASWHIAGWGLSKAALETGLVKNDQSYFPSIIFYVLILGPLVAAMLWRQFKENTMQVMLIASALAIFVFVVVSRFTHNNYFYYATTLVFLAYFGDFSTGAAASHTLEEAKAT